MVLKMVTQFFIDMVPPTHTAQEKGLSKTKTGKTYAYTKKEVSSDWDRVECRIPERMFDTLTGAVELKTIFAYPRKDRHKEGEPKLTKPDGDNLVKPLKDILTRCGYWKDDAQVFDEEVTRLYSDRPGIYVRIREVEWTSDGNMN